MKTILKTFEVVILLMMFLLMYSCGKEKNVSISETSAETTIRNFQHPCESNGECANESYIEKGYYVTTHPDYLECEFLVNFLFRRCDDDVDMIYLGFNSSDGGPECDQWVADVLTAQSNGTLNLFWDDFSKELIKQSMIQEASYDQNGNQVLIPVCGVDNDLSINLYKSGCYQYCAVANEDKQISTLELVSCGSVCCSSKNVVCKHPLTGEIIVIGDEPESVGNCLPKRDIRCSVFIEGADCIANCSSIDFFN